MLEAISLEKEQYACTASGVSKVELAESLGLSVAGRGGIGGGVEGLSACHSAINCSGLCRLCSRQLCSSSHHVSSSSSNTVATYILSCRLFLPKMQLC